MNDGGGRSSMTQAEQRLKEDLADARFILAKIASELGMTAEERQQVLSGDYKQLSRIASNFISKYGPTCICGWTAPGQQCPLHTQKTITVSRE